MVAGSGYLLSDLIDADQLRLMAEACYKASGLATSILDAADGSVLIGVGWQEICSKFHRAYPRSLKRCMESIIHIQQQDENNFIVTKCKNGLRHVAIPMFIDGQHITTFYLTQFLFNTDGKDIRLFLHQAEEFGFDRAAYLKALDFVPMFTKRQVLGIVEYVKTFSKLIATLADNTLRLQRELAAKRSVEIRQRQIEAALRESKESERFLVANAWDIHWHFDAGYRFTAVNPADERLRGYPPEDVLGRCLWDIVEGEFGETVRTRCEDFSRQPGSETADEVLRITAPCLHRGGGALMLEILLHPLRDEKGVVTGFHGLAHALESSGGAVNR